VREQHSCIKQYLLQVESAHGGIDLSSPHITAVQVEITYKVNKSETCMQIYSHIGTKDLQV